ncbi:uncharacterized protein LOC144559796 [Carex rostrata]
MDRYQRVEKPRPESAINENEIRITAQGPIRNYLNYGTSLLQEKGAKEIVFKAMGQAISKTVPIVEIIKKRIPGLHQDTSISSVSITDVWEPIEEGLVPLEMTRHVSMISISLSPAEVDKNSPGYQAPAQVEHHSRQPRRYPQLQYQPIQYQPRQNQDYGRGRGRGRGRTRRGWGSRGGYGGGYDNNQGGGYRNRDDNQGGGYGNQGGYGGGYGYNQGGYGGGYANQGGYGGGYANQENGGWNPNRSRGGRGGRGY